MSDVDGMTSSAQFYKYIKRFNNDIKIKLFIHKDKSHGLSDDMMRMLNENKFDLLIIPDAGSSDLKQIEKLKNKDIIIVDHHEVSEISPYALTINNVYSKSCEGLSGAGLTYRFLKECDKILKANYSEEFEDLMAIGMIADMMDVSNLEVNYLIQKSLDKFNSAFSKAIIKEKKIKKVTPKDISFYFAPLGNSVCRTGNHDDKVELFKILISEKEQESISKIKKVKERQDLEVKEFLKNNENNLTVLNNIVIMTTEEQNGFSGLVANKLLQKYKRPTIIYSTKTLKGSCRSPFSEDVDFRNILLETGQFEYCMGHKNACGIKIKDNFDMNILNEKLNSLEIKKSFNVDFILDYENANSFFIHEVYSISNHYSKGVEEPNILINNIPTSILEFKNGRIEGHSIFNSCYYIKFGIEQSDFDLIKSKKFINAICTGNINYFFGEKYQFNIEEYFLEDIKIIKKES